MGDDGSFLELWKAGAMGLLAVGGGILSAAIGVGLIAVLLGELMLGDAEAASNWAALVSPVWAPIGAGYGIRAVPLRARSWEAH